MYRLLRELGIVAVFCLAMEASLATADPVTSERIAGGAVDAATLMEGLR